MPSDDKITHDWKEKCDRLFKRLQNSIRYYVPNFYFQYPFNFKNWWAISFDPLSGDEKNEWNIPLRSPPTNSQEQNNLYRLLQQLVAFVNDKNIPHQVKYDALSSLLPFPPLHPLIALNRQRKYLQKMLKPEKNREFINLLRYRSSVDIDQTLGEKIDSLLSAIDGYSEQEDLARIAQHWLSIGKNTADKINFLKQTLDPKLPTIKTIDVFALNKSPDLAQALYQIIQQYPDETKFQRSNSGNGPYRYQLGVTLYELSHSIHRAEDGTLYVHDHTKEHHNRLGQGSYGVVYLLEHQLTLNHKIQTAQLTTLTDTEKKRALKVNTIKPWRETETVVDDTKTASHALIANSSVQSRYGASRGAKTRIIMPYLPGPDLAALPLKQQDAKTKLGIFRDLILDLDRIHKANFIHCDIKPGNIRKAGTGHWQLIDRDGAWPKGKTRNNINATPMYAHPAEIDHYYNIYIQKKEAIIPPPTPAIDHYALGLTLFELMTGAKIERSNAFVYPQLIQNMHSEWEQKLRKIGKLADDFTITYQPITFQAAGIPISQKSAEKVIQYIEQYITGTMTTPVDQIVADIDDILAKLTETERVLSELPQSLLANSNFVGSPFYDNNANQQKLAGAIQRIDDALTDTNSSINQLKKENNHPDIPPALSQQVTQLEKLLLTDLLTAKNHSQIQRTHAIARNTAKYLARIRQQPEKIIKQQSQHYLSACMKQSLPQKLMSGILKVIHVACASFGGFVCGAAVGTLLPIPFAGTIGGAIAGGAAGLAVSTAVITSPAYCRGLGIFRSPTTATEKQIAELVNTARSGPAPAA